MLAGMISIYLNRLMFHHQKNRNYNILTQMQDLGLTKLLDGLFLSDATIVADSPFIYSNKITHVIGWSATKQTIQGEGQYIIHLHLKKQNQLPKKLISYEQIMKMTACIEAAKEQFLCAMVYGQTQNDAAIIIIFYLMIKYKWNLQTSFLFVKSKYQQLQCGIDLAQEMELLQQKIEKQSNSNLVNIQWNFNFLSNYKPKQDDEILIINTIKNILKKPKDDPTKMTKKDRKSKRIQWSDQIRPVSAMSTMNKYYSRANPANKMFNKSSGITKIYNSSCKIKEDSDLKLFDIMKISDASGSQAVNEKKRLNSAKKKSLLSSTNKFYEEDEQFLQLKELSRTHFNDRRFTNSKLRKRSSLKTATKESKSEKEFSNFTNFLGSKRPSSAKKLVSYLSNQNLMVNSQNFIANLRSLSRVGSMMTTNA